MPADRYVHGHVGRQNMPLDICAGNNVQIQIGLLNINDSNKNNNSNNNKMIIIIIMETLFVFLNVQL